MESSILINVPRTFVPKTIKRDYTVPETPEQNGVAERYNRTVVETARSLLIEPNFPKCYWLRAVDTAAYVRNLVKKDKGEKILGQKTHKLIT